MTTQELYAKLGANYEEAKGRMMNDALINRFLLKFAQTYSLDALLAAQEKHDGHALFEAAHSLKGVCGNLALTKLYTLASDLTEKTRSLGEGAAFDASSEVALIKNEYEATVSAIRECLGQ